MLLTGTKAAVAKADFLLHKWLSVWHEQPFLFAAVAGPEGAVFSYSLVQVFSSLIPFTDSQRTVIKALSQTHPLPPLEQQQLSLWQPKLEHIANLNRSISPASVDSFGLFQLLSESSEAREELIDLARAAGSPPTRLEINGVMHTVDFKLLHLPRLLHWARIRVLMLSVQSSTIEGDFNLVNEYCLPNQGQDSINASVIEHMKQTDSLRRPYSQQCFRDLARKTMQERGAGWGTAAWADANLPLEMQAIVTAGEEKMRAARAKGLMEAAKLKSKRGIKRKPSLETEELRQALDVDLPLDLQGKKQKRPRLYPMVLRDAQAEAERYAQPSTAPPPLPAFLRDSSQDASELESESDAESAPVDDNKTRRKAKASPRKAKASNSPRAAKPRKKGKAEQEALTAATSLVRSARLAAAGSAQIWCRFCEKTLQLSKIDSLDAHLAAQHSGELQEEAEDEAKMTESESSFGSAAESEDDDEEWAFQF